MNISKEDALPTIRIHELKEIIEAANGHGYTPHTHEIVVPDCIIENPFYRDDFVWHVPLLTHEQYILARRIDRKNALKRVVFFGYDVRYDPNASTLLVLPKQANDPLPFE